MKASDYVSPYSASPVFAGTTLADAWNKERSEYIDMWGFDLFYQEFFNAFLEQCKQNNCLEDALKIRWEYPCEASNGNPSCHELATEWIADFMSPCGMSKNINIDDEDVKLLSRENN